MICLLAVIFTQVLPGQAQSVLTTLQQDINALHGHFSNEKVFLHIDKSAYLTGEILWFKAYVTDAETNQLSSVSHICYVEVINMNEGPVLQAKIALEDGTGEGSFAIPSSLRSGAYLVRAYTNWMRNFEINSFFRQKISVINTEKKVVDTSYPNKRMYAAFFPEGGNLVAGLENNIAFTVYDKELKPSAASGFLMNQSGDTILNFETAVPGMGSFRFRPDSAQRYNAVVNMGNEREEFPLPYTSSTGTVMQLTHDENFVNLHLASNDASHTTFYLVDQVKNEIVLAKEVFLSEGATSLPINKQDLRDGANRFTVFNHEKQPVCERLYFLPPKNLLHIQIENLKTTYGLRSPVAITLSAADTGFAQSSLSASVFLLDSLQGIPENNIVSYLWLTSELPPGATPVPISVMNNSRTLELLMMTNGWRKFNGNKNMGGERPLMQYLPEHEGSLISGTFFPNPGKAIAASVAVPGKYSNLALATSDLNGHIRFNLPGFYGRHELIFQTALNDTNYRIRVDQPFEASQENLVMAPLLLDKSLMAPILLRSVAAKLPANWAAQRHLKFSLPDNFDSGAFYGPASKTYDLDEFTRFKTMEEVMREYVTEVRVRNQTGNFNFRVYNENAKLYFDNEPLVLLDGVPIYDLNKIIAADPLKVKSIEIVARRFFMGKCSYDGVISYSTYDETPDVLDLDPNALVIDYEGLQFSREFYSPDHRVSSDQYRRIPDYRNVLYWTANISIEHEKGNLKFHTSDIPGKYILIVQGISPEGKAGYLQKEFSVAADR